MDKAKKMKLTQLNPYIETQNLEAIAGKTSNLYESLYIIAKRANQISKEMKEELHSKLEDFATHNDSLEEINENREQIEISRFYERLPHATIISTTDFIGDNIYVRSNEEPAAPVVPVAPEA
jgi:DNA-directed RNA polymerase subunit K/omega